MRGVDGVPPRHADATEKACGLTPLSNSPPHGGREFVELTSDFLLRLSELRLLAHLRLPAIVFAPSIPAAARF